MWVGQGHSTLELTREPMTDEELEQLSRRWKEAGEMAALKWKNVFLDRKTAKICETLVYGEEGRTKAKKSKRNIIIDMRHSDAVLRKHRLLCSCRRFYKQPYIRQFLCAKAGWGLGAFYNHGVVDYQ